MKIRFELTFGARRHAEKCGILSFLEGVEPPPNVIPGDILEFAAPNGSEVFVVRSRHFRLAEGNQTLSINLDYPVR